MAENSGVWIDKDSGEVVTTKPSRGRQLAAPGRAPTRDELATIESLGGAKAKKAPAKKASASKSDD